MSHPAADAAVCCDLDGVIWRGDLPIPGAGDAVERLRAAGLRVVFISNNSSHTIDDVVRKLAAAGVTAPRDDVLTSAVAAADLLAGRLARGSRVLACAGPGVVEAMTGAGFEIVERAPADAVVVGFHRTFDFDELDRAAAAIRDGAVFVATNLDATYPSETGLVPGTGAITAAVATATGSTAEVAGKPFPPAVAMVRQHVGTSGVVVGDRPSTDGALATALGWPFALVLSGVTSAPPPPGGEAVPDPAPPIVGADLAAVTDPIVELVGTRGA